MTTKNWLMCLIVLTLVGSSCNKQVCPEDPETPIETPVDKPVLKVKDMTVRSLPSPFYHFEYNAAGFITAASHTGDLGNYEVVYAGNRIQRMVNLNIPNQDVLQYVYNNGTLTTINITRKTGLVYRRIRVSENTSHQLLRLDWEVLNNAQFLPERYQQFSYYDDGNLKALTEHYYPLFGGNESTTTDLYEQYDDKPNAGAFHLLHPMQDMHLILLPSYIIQKNNPRKLTHTGDGTEFKVDYSYMYDGAGRPTLKTGQFVVLDNGANVEIQTTFSYYD